MLATKHISKLFEGKRQIHKLIQRVASGLGQMCSNGLELNEPLVRLFKIGMLIMNGL
jgi:hypothetical protein